MGRKKTYYKIVRNDCYKRLISLNIDCINKYCISYEPDKLVYPEIGLIFIYNDLDFAKKAMNISAVYPGNKQLWECEAVSPRKLRYACYSQESDDIKMYWEKFKYTNNQLVYYKMDLENKHVYGAKAIKLIKRIIFDDYQVALKADSDALSSMPVSSSVE